MCANDIAHLQIFDQDGVLDPMGLQEGFHCLDVVSGDSQIHGESRAGGTCPEIKLKRERKMGLVWEKHSAHSSSKALEMLISPELINSCSIAPHDVCSTFHSLVWPHHDLVSVNVRNKIKIHRGGSLFSLNSELQSHKQEEILVLYDDYFTILPFTMLQY